MASPASNANFAWLQHIISKLAERGSAGVVLANGSVSSQQSGEGEIRAAMVEADLVACMIALPPQLFRTTQIPACLWFLTKDKTPQGAKHLNDRRGEVLFINARNMGTLINRTERILTADEIAGSPAPTTPGAALPAPARHNSNMGTSPASASRRRSKRSANTTMY